MSRTKQPFVTLGVLGLKGSGEARAGVVAGVSSGPKAWPLGEVPPPGVPEPAWLVRHLKGACMMVG